MRAMMNQQIDVEKCRVAASGRAIVSRLPLLILPLCFLLVSGCVMNGRATGPKPYVGPTLSIRELVSQINANNEQLPTLRGEGSFEANINDHGKNRFLNGQITMLYSEPQAMRLIGKKDIVGNI